MKAKIKKMKIMDGMYSIEVLLEKPNDALMKKLLFIKDKEFQRFKIGDEKKYAARYILDSAKIEKIQRQNEKKQGQKQLKRITLLSRNKQKEHQANEKARAEKGELLRRKNPLIS